MATGLHCGPCSLICYGAHISISNCHHNGNCKYDTANSINIPNCFLQDWPIRPNLPTLRRLTGVNRAPKISSFETVICL